ncbi:MAG TPA: alpha/beta hydrolase [Pyrinomonadaceae bacterium]
MTSRLKSILLIFLLPLLGVAQQTKLAPPGKLVDVGGYRLHLNCTGKGGPTVVLIPGSGDFSFDWSLVQPEVSRFTRVCSYDFAGFAWSDPGPTPRTMRQDVYELHTLLQAARIKGPYVLIGHSLGGLLSRVYAGEYPSEVAGIVLIDSTHEDTVLLLQGKLVRMRELARQEIVPGVQTIKTGPPQPATQQQIDEFAERLTKSGPPKIRAPFDKLPPLSQSMRVWALSQPPKVAQSQGFLAEELQAMYLARAKQAYPLGDRPLIILLPKLTMGDPPPGVSTDELKRIIEEKRQQKLDFTNLSRNSKVILAETSSHHIQLDEPRVVIDAIRAVVEAAKQRTKLR